MKIKTGMLLALGFSAVLAGAYVGNEVFAQGTPGASNPAVVSRTRVAVMNLQEVIKAYPKYVSFQEAFKQRDKVYADKLKALDNRLKELQTKYQAQGTSEQDRTKIENEARIIRVDMENVSQEAKKELIKYHDENMTQIFKEVQQVVVEYAKANGIDMVIRFTEDWASPDTYWKPENVVRRMSMPVWPMYYDESLNITGQVSNILKSKFANAGVAPAPNGVIQTSGNK